MVLKDTANPPFMNRGGPSWTRSTDCLPGKGHGRRAREIKANTRARAPEAVARARDTGAGTKARDGA